MSDPVDTDALRYAAANSWKPLNGSDKALIAAAADELDTLRATVAQHDLAWACAVVADNAEKLAEGNGAIVLSVDRGYGERTILADATMRENLRRLPDAAHALNSEGDNNG